MNKLLVVLVGLLLVTFAHGVIAMTDQEHMDKIKEETWGPPQR